MGFDYGDGSYVTPVYTTELKKQLSDRDISDIIDRSGLKGFTVTEDSLIAYYMRPTKMDGESNEQYAKRAAEEFTNFEKAASSAHVLAGVEGTKAGRKSERLFVYGTGFGAEIGFESISGNVLPKQSADTVTPKIIAEYLTGKTVQVFKPKPLNKAQVKEQQQLAQVFNGLPFNDLKNPLVKRAYKALCKALKEQFSVLPLKIEFQTEVFKEGDKIPDGFKVGDLKPPYNNDSAAMRRDIIENNHLLVYPTTPSTFGPEGQNYAGHPLLEDSGFKDINNQPMLFNDVLRAVHDYFAHGMSEAQFGPVGEFTAWRNHMASTSDPMARWALTAETRLQNAWQNFRPEVEGVPIKDRPFAPQKAALPPVEFLFTGDNAVDLATFKMVEALSDKDKQGSKQVKYSLRSPTTPEFKRWFGDSKVVDADGKPLVVYHGTNSDFNEFKSNSSLGGGMFFAPDPNEANAFAFAKGANVLPVYLSANKPWPKIIRSYEEVNVFLKAKAGGYDSVRVRDSETGAVNWVVFSPTQIKSATGNIGTYDPNNPDIRYSLRGVAFKTAEQASEAASKTPVPDTEEFKRYIAGSQWLDENGKAKKFFHATTSDFFEFNDGVTYLSDTAEEADKWGVIAEDRLRESIY